MGRELDKEVAIRRGWTTNTYRIENVKLGVVTTTNGTTVLDPDGGMHTQFPAYSTDMNHAMILLEEMRQSNVYVTIVNEAYGVFRWTIDYSPPIYESNSRVRGVALAETICFAYLEWEEDKQRRINNG